MTWFPFLAPISVGLGVLIGYFLIKYIAYKEIKKSLQTNKIKKTRIERPSIPGFWVR